MRYLKATRTVGITYGNGEGSGNLIIKSYSNSDWAGDHVTRKSTSGFIFMLNGGPVSWCSKRQATVALSSTEAEYVALTLAAKEATWLRLLLTEVGLLDKDGQYAKIKVTKSTGTKQIRDDAVGQEGEVPSSRTLTSITALTTPTNPFTSLLLKGDNQGSIALAHNPVFYARTKHIDIQHYYICDEVAAGKIDLQYIPMLEIIADGLTKVLTQAKFHFFVQQMQMV